MAVHAHRDPLVFFEAFARRALALGRDDLVFSVSKLYFAYGLGNALFFPLLALPGAQARRAKIRNIGYGGITGAFPKLWRSLPTRALCGCPLSSYLRR